MWVHIQSQLFPDNFWYIVALDQTSSLKKSLVDYLQLSRGFRIFTEIGSWDPKKSKNFFLS